MEELPIQIECFLITWGFFENDKMPGAHLHAPVHTPVEKGYPKPTGWMPSFEGEDPPF